MSSFPTIDLDSRDAAELARALHVRPEPSPAERDAIARALSAHLASRRALASAAAGWPAVEQSTNG